MHTQTVGARLYFLPPLPPPTLIIPDGLGTKVTMHTIVIVRLHFHKLN